MNSLYLNPANIAGSKEKIEISICSFGIGADNSLGTFAKLGDITSGNINTFNNSGANTFSMLLPAAEMRGPGIMIGLNDAHQQSFALTTRIRVMNQFNNFSQSLYSLVTNPNQTAENYSYQTSNFNWTAHLWSEIGLSYGLVIFDNGQSQLKAGITLRYLGGIDYLSMKGNNLDVNYKNGSDTFYASHSDLEFASNIISANNAITNGVTASSLLSSFFGSKAGSGLGADIGLTYTYRFDDDGAVGNKDDKDIDGHKLKLSAAITDLGAITYKEGNNFIVDVAGNGYVTGTGLSENSGNYANFRNYVVGQGFTADTASRSVKVHMPTALLLSADYQVYQHVFANLTYLGNLVNRQLYGNSYYSQVTITSRYDIKLFSIGMPITYSALAHDVKLGLGFRIGGFFVGSDDMLALVSSNQHGFGFYFGGYIPIYKNKSSKEINQ